MKTQINYFKIAIDSKLKAFIEKCLRFIFRTSRSIEIHEIEYTKVEIFKSRPKSTFPKVENNSKTKLLSKHVLSYIFI